MALRMKINEIGARHTLLFPRHALLMFGQACIHDVPLLACNEWFPSRSDMFRLNALWDNSPKLGFSPHRQLGLHVWARCETTSVPWPPRVA
jgi:hypothetical protein